jgi:hypothetical protein
MIGKTCRMHGDLRNAYKMLDGKRGRPFGRSRNKYEDITSNMKLRETGCYGMYFVQMARNRAQW